MFSGIVEFPGKVVRVEQRGSGRRLEVEHADPAGELRIGDSMAINGACLTVAGRDHGVSGFDVSGETLSCTTLGGLRAGDTVNMERALRASDRLNGHIVSGHVDAVGEILAQSRDGESQRFEIGVPATLSRYLCRKGSICVDGVSLTINEVDGSRFGVNIIPHTFRNTTFGTAQPGTRVNLEVDIVARYLERLLADRS